MIAMAAEHSEKGVADPVYKYFGGEGYKERQAAVVGFQNVIENIYQQVSPVMASMMCLWPIIGVSAPC